jgi:cytochrome bd-type quinol oxidase subunit 2
MFKLILVVLIIAMLISLGVALKALFREQGQPVDRSKTMKWLTIRISLAVAIALVVIVGLMTGELSIGAPWLGQY